MIIAEGRDVLRHDFHTRSLQSACGIHTVAEILEIAAQKGTETVNVCDHGHAAGRKMNFSVIANRKRTPMAVRVAVEGKTNLEALQQMIEAARAQDVTLLCNSDGHTWHELFECGAARALVEDEMNLVMEEGLTDDEIGAVQSIVMGVSAGRIRAQFREVRENLE